MEVISKISLIRFIDGGAAILAVVEINHHKHITGSSVRRPLEIKILRVLVVS